MKRIVFFISSLEEGGAQRVVSILSNKLAESSFDVTVLTYFDEEINYEMNDKVKVVSVIKETGKKGKLQNINWLKNYFNNNADIVISFLAPFNMLVLACGTNVPIIVADRNDPNKIPSNFIIRKIRDTLYKKANLVVLQTKSNQKYFDYLTNTKVISNPIEIGNDVGLALNAKKENVIVSVARLMPQKNQLMLIDAFKEVSEKHNEYKLVVFGEGPYRKTLQKHIEEINLKNNILLAGNSKNVFNDIKNAKIFVLSSNYEGMPNSLIEAMCLGLPVISTKVSGTEELIEDGTNGLLIDINSKEQLVSKLELLINDEELRNKLGKNATKLARTLTVGKISKQWIECINEVINE